MNKAIPVIEFRNVTKVYGSGNAELQALKGISFKINEGDFVAVMGPSGSGKSTSMNIVGCLDKMTSGSYLFCGVPVESLSRDQLAMLRRNNIGFVFQGFNLLRRTSALENVELPMLYRGENLKTREQLAREALAEVGLTGWERHTSSELSGGQQQRVAIARAIVTKPKILLADEPTGNLDTKRGHEIMELITKLNKERGITVVIVTHEADIAAYAQRTIRFLDGNIEEQSNNK